MPCLSGYEAPPPSWQPPPPPQTQPPPPRKWSESGRESAYGPSLRPPRDSNPMPLCTKGGAQRLPRKGNKAQTLDRYPLGGRVSKGMVTVSEW